MTPRKALFVAIRNRLAEIAELELVDLHRNQMSDHDEWTGTLIRISNIEWEHMTNYRQEGRTSVEILLYCRDGWMDQFSGTADPNDGLNETDLIDTIAEKLFLFSSAEFSELHLEDEKELNLAAGIFSYSMTFSTKIYREFNPYTMQKINAKPDIDVSDQE